MSLPRHKLVEELHKFARLVKGEAFDPYTDGVTEVLSVAAAMLETDGQRLAEQTRRAEVAEAWQARLTTLLAQARSPALTSQDRQA